MIYVLSGGAVGATLIVSCPSNVTVTVSKGNKTYTKNSGNLGSATFKGLDTGTWTVKIQSSSQTATKNITITTDYEITMAFFAAYINITYPANSTCTVKTSGGVTVASNSNTGTSTKTWRATVGATGTYTITATSTSDSSKTKSTTVSITADGQSKSVTLRYELVLFDYGDKTSVTGGWNTSALRFKQVTGQSGGKAPTVTTNSDGSITLGGLSAGNSGSYITVNKINLAGYSTVKFIGSVTSDDSAMTARSGFAASKNLTEFLQANAAASMNFPASTSKTYSGTESFLDISSLTDSYYLLFGVYNTTKITIKKLWLV